MSQTASTAGARALHRVGTRAVLVDLAGLEDVMAWHAALSARPLPDQRDVIAAASTLLVTLNTPAAAQHAYEFLSEFAPAATPISTGREITLDVVYDGADLEPLASALGISPQALIERHTQEIWTAAFGGFAPGFTYCVPAVEGWEIARRESPRTAVPAGTVALAGNFSAVYPRETPGGWQLIGSTAAPLWDETAHPPALITPGDTVRYRAVRAHAEAGAGSTSAAASTGTSAAASTGASSLSDPAAAGGTPVARAVLEVVDAGLQTLYQDTGRAGAGGLGVAPSGVVDRASAWTANSLVGNHSSAAVLENIGGLRLRALVDVVLAVTGAEARTTITAPGGSGSPGAEGLAGASVSTGAESGPAPRPQPLGHPVLLRAGEQLRIEPPSVGLRSYVAVRGGFAARTVLGSAAVDVLSGLGPDPVRAGDIVTVRAGASGTDSAALKAVAPPAPNPLRLTGPHATLRCVLGPREDWFAPAERARFVSLTWEVTGQSNRVGLRLVPSVDEPDTGAGADPGTGAGTGAGAAAEPLERANSGELASEGMVAGSVQVPPNGCPVLFLADHPVTGGYPVIATVVVEDLDIAGQLPPGSTVSFELVDARTLRPLTTPPIPNEEDLS